jgi:hypothetical protein
VTGLLADYRRVGLPSPAAQGNAWHDQSNSSPPDALRQWAEAQVARRIRGDPLGSGDRRAAYDNADTTSNPTAYDPFEAAAERVRTAISPIGGRDEGGLTRLSERLVPAILGGWATRLATLPRRAIEGSERMRLAHEYDPAIFEAASLVAGGPVFGRSAAAPRPTPRPLESKSSGMYDPPAKPARPFEADYPRKKWPNGPPADAAGRLTHDMEGRPLTAEYVVGRRMAGGPDEAFPPDQHDALTKALTGEKAAHLPAHLMDRMLGVTFKDRRGRAVFLRDDLAPADLAKVHAHENGHVILDANQIPTKDLVDELRAVYNTLNNPNRTRDGLDAAPWARLYGPSSRGYSFKEIPEEYTAEAVRAYMTNPNYFKAVAPNTAAAIRAVANRLRRSKDAIQFNSIGPGIMGAAGLPPRTDEGE